MSDMCKTVCTFSLDKSVTAMIPYPYMLKVASSGHSAILSFSSLKYNSQATHQKSSKIQVNRYFKFPALRLPLSHRCRSAVWVSGSSLCELRRCLFGVLTFRADNPLAVLCARSRSLTFQPVFLSICSLGESRQWTRQETSARSFHEPSTLAESDGEWVDSSRTKDFSDTSEWANEKPSHGSCLAFLTLTVLNFHQFLFHTEKWHAQKNALTQQTHCVCNPLRMTSFPKHDCAIIQGTLWLTCSRVFHERIEAECGRSGFGEEKQKVWLISISSIWGDCRPPC